MRAAVYDTFGLPDVVRIEDVAKPVPKDDEVLIEVHAASVNPLDWHFMRGKPLLGRVMMGFRKPRVPRLGVDVAGRVEAVGPKVKELKAGDEVFGVCQGAFADYACAPEGDVVVKPGNISFEQAASTYVAAGTALQGLRDKGHVQPGHKVLINGAGGGVGMFAVQIAKLLGAHVTGVCSTAKVDMVRSLGADAVIDHTKDDFTKSGPYDLIFDCFSTHSFSDLRRALKPDGVYMMVGGPVEGPLGPLPRLIRMLVYSLFVSQKLFMFLAAKNRPVLIAIRDYLAAGQLTPVIDRSYALSDIREALRYLGAGHARGKVVIRVNR